MGTTQFISLLGVIILAISALVYIKAYAAEASYNVENGSVKKISIIFGIIGIVLSITPSILSALND